jgi:hypothetical protein
VVNGGGASPLWLGSSRRCASSEKKKRRLSLILFIYKTTHNAKVISRHRRRFRQRSAHKILDCELENLRPQIERFFITDSELCPQRLFSILIAPPASGTSIPWQIGTCPSRLRLCPIKGLGSAAIVHGSTFPFPETASNEVRNAPLQIFHYRMVTDGCSNPLSIAPMNVIEQSKKLAAYNAVDHHVRPEHRVSIVSTNICILVL